MKLSLKPQTNLGRWAAVLSISFIILISLKVNPGIPLPEFAITGLGIAGFITGIVAVIKKDLAVMALISILVGLVCDRGRFFDTFEFAEMCQRTVPINVMQINKLFCHESYSFSPPLQTSEQQK